MKLFLLVPLLATLNTPCFAQQGHGTLKVGSPEVAETASDEFSQVTERKIEGWGRAVDPDQDCEFYLSKDALIISTPASLHPHDFSPELSLTNAPRVIHSVSGDFSFQVKVDDRLDPGDDSTLPGRVGYHGAVIMAIADEQNVVTLARALIKSPDEGSASYANFEMRVGGKLLRIGMTDDHPLPKTGPVFLRLERRGNQITGSVSIDGSDWSVVRSETLPEDWAPRLKIGVMAVNTSKRDFSPRFSMMQRSTQASTESHGGS